MVEELAYRDEAAAEYDRAFAHVSQHFVPFLLSAARLAVDPPAKRISRFRHRCKARFAKR
jgi:hypothetical protein